MVQKGCDLLTIQQVMRHNHITTTMRYLHPARILIEHRVVLDKDERMPGFLQEGHS